MIAKLLRRWLWSAGVLTAAASGAEAQLRPLHPPDWEVFDSGRTGSARLGVGVLLDQRASLAGTEGRLLELGDFAFTLRSGRMGVELGGTVLRVFEDEKTFAAPYGGARESTGATRRDVGDFRVATLVLLTPPGQAASAVLRFGTRLPTTDNGVGLERDRTDFFALLGGRLVSGSYLLAGEAGVGINGTHDEQLEQSDVLMYSVTAAYRRGTFSPRVSLLGHFDGMAGMAIRGNEELAEVRIGARVGRRFWAEAEMVRGLQPFSPRGGLLLSAGLSY